MTKRNTYTKEYKLEAVRLLEAGNQYGSVIARELGLRRNILYKWPQKLSTKGDEAFKGAGSTTVKDGKVAELEQENRRLKEEVEILKKAAVDSIGRYKGY